MRPLSWQKAEYGLLGLFLASKLWLLWQQYGMGIGFDGSHHIEMLAVYTWNNLTADLQQTAYSYHPPVGFLLARAIFFALQDPIASIQVLSWLCSLIAFFALRGVLQKLDILHSARGTIFLYLTNAIPLMVFISVNINLDIIIFAITILVLGYAIRAYWLEQSRRQYVLLHIWILIALVLGMLTKFSGLLLFAIPFLVAICNSNRQQLKLHIASSLAVSIFAAAAILPYYTVRYYKQTGSFFPSNTEWIIPDEMQAAKEARDADTAAFTKALFSPTSVHKDEGYTFRDYDNIRLSDTWRDFWVKDQYLGPTTTAAENTGVWLMKLSPLALVLGLGIFLFARKRVSPFMSLGWVLLLYSTVILGAFVKYLYDTPLAAWGPGKGIYIAALCLPIAYLLTQAFTLREHPVLVRLSLFGTATLIVLTHALPMY